ncbi:DinB family protein [Nocardioides humilatus]|uniref:DinB family protein n=1 Tax=Nocardioides humilatus TaxID=2607660 RepID=A0A5B1LH74_9ACTN|nr:DinB family protein [Nocardioides humilatus]KAA1418977.1 DinB family protein [Nocardioides humilatus]
MDPDGRNHPPLAGDEVTTLRAFLDYHRDTLRWKVEGLTQAQQAQRLEPSTMTLGGMMKHLALVESSWFEVVLGGGDYMPPFDGIDWEKDQDWDWDSAVEDTPEQLRALFDEAVTRADRVIDEAVASPSGLDTLSARPSRRSGNPYSLRWILLHMIEEYARHNGHADLIRESIDGLTGD